MLAFTLFILFTLANFTEPTIANTITTTIASTVTATIENIVLAIFAVTVGVGTIFLIVCIIATGLVCCFCGLNKKNKVKSSTDTLIELDNLKNAEQNS